MQLQSLQRPQFERILEDPFLQDGLPRRTAPPNPHDSILAQLNDRAMARLDPASVYYRPVGFKGNDEKALHLQVSRRAPHPA